LMLRDTPTFMDHLLSRVRERHHIAGGSAKGCLQRP
jgi:hypothetical protein